MKFLMREADFKDISQLKDLASHFCLGSLSTSPTLIENKINISKDSFSKKIRKEDRNFLFVLEDCTQNKIIGSSQILSSFEKKNFPYFLKVEEGNKKYLKLTNSTRGKHQLGGLILHPNYRETKDRLGLLLGGIRYLYIKTYLEDFSEVLEVNLTAPIYKDQRYNAFWEEIGRTYLDKDVVGALEIYRKNKAEFFSIFPKNLKISIESLSPQARQSLKIVHPETQPAYEALLKFGFYKTGKYHLMDGGVYLEAETQKIPLISQSSLVPFKKGDSKLKSSHLCVQETRQGFFGGFVEGSLEHGIFYLKETLPFLDEDKQILVKNCPSRNLPEERSKDFSSGGKNMEL